MKQLAECHIAVVGLGLMGGSIAAALCGRCRLVVGVARRPETIDEAVDRGVIDRGSVDPADVLPSADIVILATPVRTILNQIRDFGPILRGDCLLMDLGSTKETILSVMSDLPDGVQPLGGHPMCGKEQSGLGAIEASLYRGCTFILTPLERTSAEALDLGRAVVEAIGAVPLVLEAVRQDRLVATLSHLPYLLACSLVQTADATTSADPAAWEIVAGGYRDTSRVAGSDVSMMLDILITNRRAVLAAADVFRDKLSELTDLLEADDERGLRELLAASRVERQRMFP